MTTATREYISPAETAALLRAHLKRAFPGAGFRVNTHCYSGGASIRVYWTNGPTSAAVDKIAQGYKGGGFDGMIDMAYSYRSYLLPDNTMVVAGTSGTENSAGSVPGWETPMPEGARPVTTTNDFVFTHRNFDVATLEAETKAVCDEFRLPSADQWVEAIPGEQGARTAREAANRRLSLRDLPLSRYLPWNKGGT
jgi:hypothetical protein